jgi:hypothetical protein
MELTLQNCWIQSFEFHDITRLKESFYLGDIMIGNDLQTDDDAMILTNELDIDAEMTIATQAGFFGSIRHTIMHIVGAKYCTWEYLMIGRDFVMLDFWIERSVYDDRMEKLIAHFNAIGLLEFATVEVLTESQKKKQNLLAFPEELSGLNQLDNQN